MGDKTLPLPIIGSQLGLFNKKDRLTREKQTSLLTHAVHITWKKLQQRLTLSGGLELWLHRNFNKEQ